MKISPHILSSITPDQAWHYRIVPYNIIEERIFFYIDKSYIENGFLEEVEILTGKEIMFNETSSQEIEDLLLLNYKKSHADVRQQEQYYHGDPDHFLSYLISEAKSLNSSDIHIESFEEKCRVRVRIDGMLVQRYLLEKKQYPALINKIKINANLDISEKRLPQDGRIFFEDKISKFDIRVSVLPTLYGEKVVLRLLNNNVAEIDLDRLGFSRESMDHYLEGIRRPNGILLISGPTGSGKTTTLYATLKELNKETRNILTIEDPIEYTLQGINQVQLRESIGLTFSAALRTFLRQDPDVIMVGEIRDTETANMAIRAALTGHLVLSTIHTNSAWGIVSRLIDMGVAPYLLASTLNTAVAQRLVRQLCSTCKVLSDLDPALYPRKFVPYKKMTHHFIAVGCPECFNTGYRGRQAIYEVLPIDETLAEHIKSSNENIDSFLKMHQFKLLSENAFDLFEKGITSLDEIYPLLMN